MSSVYRNLSEIELHREKITLQAPLDRGPGPSAMRWAVAGTASLALAALVTTGLLLHSWSGEKGRRQTLEELRLNLEGQLAQAEKTSAAQAQTIARLEKKASDLELQIQKQKTELSASQTREKGLQAESAALKSQLGALQEKFTAFDEKVQAIEKQRASAAAPASGEGRAAAAGEVLSINEKFGFIVFNLGAQDGIQAGALVDIQRDGKTLAVAVVEKTYDHYSAATLAPDRVSSDPRVGDQVVPSAVQP